MLWVIVYKIIGYYTKAVFTISVTTSFTTSTVRGRHLLEMIFFIFAQRLLSRTFSK